MRIKSLGMRLVIIGVVLIAGILLGFYGLDVVTANNRTHLSQELTIIYPTNENGETYGSAAYAPTPDEEPDLISAVGIDGTNGYVRKADLDGEKPKTPKEALAQQSMRAGKEYRIPLYEVDGKTVIGEFAIVSGDGKIGDSD